MPTQRHPNSLHYFASSRLCAFAFILCLITTAAHAQQADLIFHNGKVVTVDADFSVRQAVAIRDGKVVRVGSNEAVLKLKGDQTKLVNLHGKTVLPGLMDSHTHPTGAAMHEFDHRIPSMQSIDDVLKYIKSRADVLDDGEWVFVSQVFVTRLDERRYPTRQELDKVAPLNPVFFRTGPDASLNSLALKLSGIDKDFKPREGESGYIERDPQTGEPTGILRNLRGYVKYVAPKSGKTAAEQDRYRQLLTLFKDYNAVGLTAIADRAGSSSAVDRYQRMHDNGDLPLRVAVSRHVGTGGKVEVVQHNIRKVAQHALAMGNEKASDMLRVVGVKVFLDGGMLTGSAYMRKPWGVSQIYAIKDPKYRGLLFVQPDKLEPIVRTAVEHGLQFTAHSVGDGAVHTLLDAYAAVSKDLQVRHTRPCITHSNFMSAEAIQRMAELGVVADIQPAWLYLDVRTLSKQFSNERLRYFQPLKTIFEHGAIAGGGSDHMQKIGSMRAVNPYNPWLGMWTTITRRPRDYGGQRFHPEEALSREQAIRFYTTNNAHILFLDKVAGSLEVGKHADLIVIDRDVLTCPVDDILKTKVHRTFVAGKLVHTDGAALGGQ